MNIVIEVITIGSCLPDFLGASCSGSAFSAPVVSRSILLVLRGEKNLQVITAFVGSLKVEDFGTDRVDLLVVCEVSSE
jgi:hypothetical protein